MWERIGNSLLNWETALVDKLKHEGVEYRSDDRKWVDEQIPRIERDLNLASMRVHKLEELIAKARTLLQELEDNACKVLTGKDGVPQVGAFLKEKFGDQLEKNYTHGRRTMCAALEEHYHIGPHVAREVFSILKEAKVIRFTMQRDPGRDVPPTTYPAEEEVVIYDEVFVSPASNEPRLKPVWEID